MAKAKRKNVAIVMISAEVVLPEDAIQSAEALIEVNARAESAAAMFPDGTLRIKVASRKALPLSEPKIAAPPVNQAA